MKDILRLERVTKRYGSFAAVDQVGFSVPEGVVFGLLGPNGAGKTSLIRIITSITRADEGEVWFAGERLSSEHPRQIGYMPEERGLYKKMGVAEQLTYLARLKGMSANDTRQALRYWLDRLGMMDWQAKKIEELSKGMQQKVQFVATVMHGPRLLILDEPLSGLDPINANLINEEIKELNGQGTSIIFSTHRMEQVEEMCDHIVLINRGRNVLEGQVKEIKQRFKENLFQIGFEGALPELQGMEEHGFGVVKKNGQSLLVKFAEGSDSNEVLRFLIGGGVRIRAFNEILPSINEIFIRQVSEGE